MYGCGDGLEWKEWRRLDQEATGIGQASGKDFLDSRISNRENSIVELLRR